MPDLGFTHVALTVIDTDKSVQFYARYADMTVVHRRPGDAGTGDVVWLSDGTRPFVIVLLPQDNVDSRLAGPLNHLGIGVSSRAEVDRRLALAHHDGFATYGPHDSGPPVGYWGTIDDPDGHTIEIAFGQEVGLTVTTPTTPATSKPVSSG